MAPLDGLRCRRVSGSLHEVPPVTSPVRAAGWRIVLTWVLAPLVQLHVHGVCFFAACRLGARQVGGPFKHVWCRGDLFKGSCLTRVSAEELIRELLGTAPGDGRLEFPSLQRVRLRSGTSEELRYPAPSRVRGRERARCHDFSRGQRQSCGRLESTCELL